MAPLMVPAASNVARVVDSGVDLAGDGIGERAGVNHMTGDMPRVVGDRGVGDEPVIRLLFCNVPPLTETGS